MNKTDKGLRAYKERKWTEAFRLFMESDAEEGLSPEYLEKLAIAAYLSGKLNESIASWTRAYQEYADNDFNERAARCAFWLGMELMNTGERSRGGGWIARAGHIIEEYGRTCVEQGFLMLPAALQYLGKNDPENAYRKFRKAGEIGQTFKNPELMILAGLGKGQSLILKNKITEGSALLDEAMVAVESDEVSPIVVGIVYCAVIETCRKIYDLERAGEWISVLSRWCESQPEAAPFRDQCLVRRAELLQLRGDWAEAMNETLRACDIFGKIPGAPVAGAAYYCKGESYRLRGDFNQAEDAYRQASRLGKVPQPGLSLLHLAKGDVDGAQKSIIPVKDKYKDTLELLDILPAYAEIMLAAGNKPYAENAAKELSEIAEELKTPFILAVALRTTGSVLLTNDHAQQALNNFHEASVIFAKLNAMYDTGRSRYLAGIACQRLNDKISAEMEFDAARQIFQKLGAITDLEKIDSINLKNKNQNIYGLTGRELEILQHMTTGQTNKKIADSLFISERTVDRHVSNIFNKLGVSSRSAATACAYKYHLL